MSKHTQSKRKTSTPDTIIRAGVQVTVDGDWTAKLPTEIQEQITASGVDTADVTLAYTGDRERAKDPTDTFRKLQRMSDKQLIVKGYYYQSGKQPALVLVVICAGARHYMILCRPSHLCPLSLMSHLSQGKYGKLISVASSFHIPFRPFKSTDRGRYIWD